MAAKIVSKLAKPRATSLSTSKLALRLYLVFSATAVALAGPPPTCIRAVTSSNGQFLVITDVQLEQSGSGTYRARRGSLNILGKERFIEQTLSSSNAYWESTPAWTITLTPGWGGFVIACPLSLVTDDGNYLVLLNDTSEFDPSLKIYRRGEFSASPPQPNSYEGVLVKEVNWRALWPASITQPTVRTDETPEWYSGGTFEFSKDSRFLVHHTRWGNTVRIHLEDGSVYK